MIKGVLLTWGVFLSARQLLFYEQHRNGDHRKAADADVAGYIHNSKSHYGSGVGPQGIKVGVACFCVAYVIERVLFVCAVEGRGMGGPGGMLGEGVAIRIIPWRLYYFVVDAFSF